ncbi:MAG: D-amino acid aminotransferase [Clostridia bacterium]|nr:D-amino acid aminotransferase [Clostridia bacterium]
MRLVYLNGCMQELEEAKISVQDRGFLFGDGIYEVIWCWQGRLFRLEAHLERLEKSAEAIELELPLSRAELAEVARGLAGEAHRSGLNPAQIYIQVTRGPAERNHAFPESPQPTVLAMVQAAHLAPPQYREQGVKVITTPDIRWRWCRVKSINLLPNVLAKEKAKRQGAYEAIFCEESGTVNEGSSTNIFLVKDGVIITPSLDNNILPGITRAAILEAVRAAGLAVEERRVYVDELYAADEVFLSGTLSEVMPVVVVDDRTVGSGQPGPLTRQVYQLLLGLMRQELGPDLPG